jgi:ribosomal-protein-serine acetyltransferase
MLKSEIKGDKIILKKKTTDKTFAELLLKTLDENRKYLSKWLDWVDKTTNLDETIKLLEDYETRFKEQKLVNYSIFLQKKFIGDIAIFNIDWENKECERGCWVIEKESNKGYATEAIKLIEHEIYEKMNFKKIIIKCEDKNEISNHNAKKFGYSFLNKEKDGERTYLVYSKIRK